jgi:hypothetical protein
MIRPLIVFGAVVALVLCAPLATMAQETPGRTDARYILPYGPDGLNSSLNVTETVSAACTSDSIATPNRPDAWDCAGENNQIYDPCFENPFLDPDGPAELACFTDPFSTDVVVVTLDEPLTRTKEAPAQGPLPAWDVPWGVELANGDRCVLLNDIDVALAGESVYYGCADGGSILGELDRSQPVWTVSYLADGAVASELVDVTTAWS